MSKNAKLRKDESDLVVKEIGLSVPESVKKIDIKRLVEDRDVFKNDFEFVKGVMDQELGYKNRKSGNESQFELERFELERIKAKLKLLQLKANSNNADTSDDSECVIESAKSVDSIIKSMRILTFKVTNKSE